MTKSISVIIGIVLAVVAGLFVVSQREASAPAPSVNEATYPEGMAPEEGEGLEAASAPVDTGTAKVRGITSAEVAKHASRSSCWSIVGESVYDLTGWISNHPGGEEAILGICGVDGTENFNKAHEGKPEQAATLANFKIGALAK